MVRLQVPRTKSRTPGLWPRRGLQVCVALGGLVPVGAGLGGVVLGATFLPGDDPSLASALSLSGDSHLRYLSGLLLAVGLAFWSTIPAIERRTALFRLLTFVVFVGGLARLYGATRMGLPSAPMLFGLGMELVATPLLCLWQTAVAAAPSAGPPGGAAMCGSDRAKIGRSRTDPLQH